ncbi:MULTISPECIES: hypothetical protein [unclassified Variovorax]|uniref:hypothetical protein n=1 Tax=unclassified Variovorax TaxID=663243 RepID=UPI00076DE46D|nr:MULTISPECIES: hypothetical protein [unclassified Variovorax]KWT95604.1 hypothetical protein APY03_2481 [Variovorax sp. WDL1]PNG50215.1 hypothetical protein CHC06_05838 [Variovorax sp. B2]PNG51088.1 hypothetical protein CHC07_05744 [Variovorax sp. B4]VTU42370.1 hypothetical protein SRS16P1_00253 [Variovorax sp. SRS16]VTU42397.1 hypothetical protein E5P1_00251 [Variovorax sp. PBL-E5]
MFNLNFPLLKGQADLTLLSSRNLQNEVVYPRAACFTKLALSIAELFRENESMSRFQLTVLAKPEAQDTETSLDFKVTQSIAIGTDGVDVFPDKDSKEAFYAANAPFHMMGSGSISVERNDEVLQGILVATDYADLSGKAHHLAEVLASTFKAINPTTFDFRQVL